MEQKNVSRNVDVVFCIDATGSMGPIMDNIKANAIRFYGEVVEACYEHKAEVKSLRVRVIAFRDYDSDGEKAMEQSTFYELPTDEDLFADYLKTIVPDGGGDEPENGLEALHYAFRSDFVNEPKDRQVIVLITDADALPLGDRRGKGCYPDDMSTEDELINTWACTQGGPAGIKLTPRGKRLVFFAPAGTKYQELSTKLKGSIFVAVDPRTGLEGVDFSDVVKVIAASVGGQ